MLTVKNELSKYFITVIKRIYENQPLFFQRRKHFSNTKHCETEYIGKIYQEVKARPKFIVDKEI